MTKQKARLVSAIMAFVFFVYATDNCGASESAEKQRRNLQIEQLKLQRKILKTMDLYEEFSKESVERGKRLYNLLGNTSYSEAAELFQNNRIPNELIPAHSAWTNLVDNETNRQLLRLALDNWAQKNELLRLEREIENIDARIKIGGVLTETEQEAIGRLRVIAAQASSVDPISFADRMEGASRANESIEKMMSTLGRER